MSLSRRLAAGILTFSLAAGTASVAPATAAPRVDAGSSNAVVAKAKAGAESSSDHSEVDTLGIVFGASLGFVVLADLVFMLINAKEYPNIFTPLLQGR
ncbi:hypothetical protein [Corynebacterium sp.]|uniref:hypothetical protein n=1 Tax=Corynebacterium sp. TaxID=1720 RepID=UPI0026DA96B2|nr:hypothetical protein [Corynebacterium sp.]MDO5032810.1 hypothetical protein [Corynebacterium sp.]